MSSLKAVLDFKNYSERFSVVSKKKKVRWCPIPARLTCLKPFSRRTQETGSSPLAAFVWSHLHIQKWNNFSEGQNNSDPFALARRHHREHHRRSMIGSCSSAGSTEWRWRRRQVHDLANRRDCRANTGVIPDQDLISVWGKKTTTTTTWLNS